MGGSSDLLQRLRALRVEEAGKQTLTGLRQEVWARSSYLKKTRPFCDEFSELRCFAKTLTKALNRARLEEHNRTASGVEADLDNIIGICQRSKRKTATLKRCMREAVEDEEPSKRRAVGGGASASAQPEAVEPNTCEDVEQAESGEGAEPGENAQQPGENAQPGQLPAQADQAEGAGGAEGASAGEASESAEPDSDSSSSVEEDLPERSQATQPDQQAEDQPAQPDQADQADQAEDTLAQFDQADRQAEDQPAQPAEANQAEGPPTQTTGAVLRQRLEALSRVQLIELSDYLQSRAQEVQQMMDEMAAELEHVLEVEWLVDNKLGRF